MTHSAIVGSILGTAVGDAIGLPYEGMSRRRGQRLLGEPDRHRFFLGRGMVSDDTEHTCMVAQALIASGADPEWFSWQLAKRFRWWLLGFPAGVGKATLKATVKLWIGFSPQNSGVYSAGNGPAMRSAVLGVAIANRERLRTLVRIGTRITHTDPKAEHGAWAVALAAQLAKAGGIVPPPFYLAELSATLPAEATEFRTLMERAVRSVTAGESTGSFAESEGLGKGVSGYVYHTVPVALHAWLRHQHDFRAGVEAVIRCGGDTDTTAAIVGGLIGASVGKEGIPAVWRERLLEWPRTVAWMEALGHRLEEGKPGPAPRLSPAVIARNGFFFLIVLGHIVRRCLPPY